jgi:hypothetical protein
MERQQAASRRFLIAVGCASLASVLSLTVGITLYRAYGSTDSPTKLFFDSMTLLGVIWGTCIGYAQEGGQEAKEEEGRVRTPALISG